MTEYPTKLREVVDACLTHQRAVAISPGEDSGGSPFVSLQTKWGDAKEIRLTWHTRDNNGRYRFFSGLAAGFGGGWRDVTITRALELIAGAG